MASNFLIVGQQVLVMFIMILTGYVCTRCKYFSDECIKGVTKFILNIVIPCVIVNSFHREFDAAMLKGLLEAFGCAVLVHALNALLAALLVRDRDESRRRVLQFGVVFSNCGYMALPLQGALLGDDGVFYGAVFIAVYNIANWTYGLVLMDSSAARISARRILVNPGIIGVAAGLVFFLAPLKLPQVLLSPVQSFAALNTPLPMVVIGYYLAQIPLFAVLKDGKLCAALVLRLLAAPLAALLALRLLGVRGTILLSTMIAAAAPSGANTVMFSVMYKRDSRLAVTLVAVSTLFSVLTMPLVVLLAMSFM